ncbi:MAG: shikimate dehydrogenase family protein [Alphaproteobacteria bacterium]
MTREINIPPVRGSTLLTGTVGDPVYPIRAPEVMGPWFAARKIDAVWLTFHVSPDDLPGFIAGARAMQNLAGFTVTMPHKQTILGHLDEITQRARNVGAANLVRREAGGRLVGDTVDGVGFTDGLERAKVPVAGQVVWLLGAGGVGSAIAFAIAELAPECLILEDRDPARAQRLKTRLANVFPTVKFAVGPVDLASVDIAINATPVGMNAGDPLPFDPADLSPSATVVDVIMTPEVTPLMRRATTQTRIVLGGRSMLDGQLARYAAFFGLTNNS